MIGTAWIQQHLIKTAAYLGKGPCASSAGVRYKGAHNGPREHEHDICDTRAQTEDGWIRGLSYCLLLYPIITDGQSERIRALTKILLSTGLAPSWRTCCS